MEKDFEYSVRTEIGGDNPVVVDLSGSVFVSNLNDFREILREQSVGSFRHVVLNFSEIDFLGSTAIGLLVETSRLFEKLGKRMWIVSLSEEISDVFTKLMIDEMLTIRSGEDEALREIQRSK